MCFVRNIDKQAKKGPLFPNATTETTKKNKKKEVAEKIFIFDDLGGLLRDPSICQLLKTNRHEKSKVIISSQWITDLQPQAILQIDIALFFAKFPQYKLEEVHKLLGISLSFPKLLELYKYATKEPFNFLFIDVKRELFRKNFSMEISNVKVNNSDDEEPLPTKKKQKKT